MTQEVQIVECENKLLTAILNNDIETLEALLHDDLIFTIPNGDVINKSIDIESHRSGLLTVHNISLLDQRINSFDDISVVTIVLQLQGKYAEQKIDGKFRYLRIWKRFNKSWKVIAGSGYQIEKT